MTKLKIGDKAIPQKQWDVLILFIDNKTYQEIAKELGISTGTVKQRLKTFKDNFPDAYEDIWDMKKMDAETKRNIQNPSSLSGSEGERNYDVAVGESLTSDGKGPKAMRRF